MYIETFFDKETSTFTYVIVDETLKKSAIVDSVLNYNQYSGRTSTKGVERIVKYIEENHLDNEWILETHIHADHITAAKYLKEKVGGKTGIGSRIKNVLTLWVPKFDISNDTDTAGNQFDQLFNDGDIFQVGNLTITVWHTPGHTPVCASYLVENSIFVGDTIFAPHLGTARCDFPGGSATELYKSIQRIYSLPDNTKIYLCHDYPKENEKPISCVEIRDEKKLNVMLKPETTMEEYVHKREERDKLLTVPLLLLPSIQANMRLGDFGATNSNGLQYIKIPINAI